MTSDIDLHTHSTASDGMLTPAGLVGQAKDQGVATLALTDHDTTAGLAEASAAARELGIDLVPGIELSVSWSERLLHVVGLHIDPDHRRLRRELDQMAGLRERRAEQMGQGLARHGIPGVHACARALAGDGRLTRTHFARCLVQMGHAKDIRSVFGRFLVPGKPGYVPTPWPTLEEGIHWITAAGGTAVLAHPARYDLSAPRLRDALAAFAAAGGTALEVVCATNTRDETLRSARHARRHNLAGSVGSDFHGPETPWARLGNLPALPGAVDPVWATWQSAGSPNP